MFNPTLLIEFTFTKFSLVLFSVSPTQPRPDFFRVGHRNVRQDALQYVKDFRVSLSLSLSLSLFPPMGRSSVGNKSGAMTG